MRALDDIIIGFLIFFVIDKAIRLFTNSVIEPWAESRTNNTNVVENWKISTELVCLIIVTYIIFKFRKTLQRFDNT
jgi:hypothetical protein